MRFTSQWLRVILAVLAVGTSARAGDHLHDLQKAGIEQGRCDAAHWGWDPRIYSLWTTHSNRLVPVYTYGTQGAGRGLDLANYTGKHSVYRNKNKIARLYRNVPPHTLNPTAEYLDQTNLFDLQRHALEHGKKHIILVVFDGMDWQTTRAAAIYNQQAVTYSEGRGSGTHFQEYTAGGTSQFGFMVTSPHNTGTNVDANRQSVNNPGGTLGGGYDVARGGPMPWTSGNDDKYLVSRSEEGANHAYTDSASSATSMMAGIKTYNNAINVDPHGNRVRTIAHLAQQEGFHVGAVSSVPISHATIAAAYAHNVHRNDYQDLARDIIGLPSIAHPDPPLKGLDVAIGGGFGVEKTRSSAQGENFVPGNVFLTAADLETIDVANGGNYVVATRTSGVAGGQGLQRAADEAARGGNRLLGFYGVAAAKGHLPYQTANGDYKPTVGCRRIAEAYTAADVKENPTLAEMTRAALTVLETTSQGFWLLVEAGDVDWANHDNNLDNAIGAVNSGDDAVKVITDWVEKNSNWDESLVVVTADHGHYLFLDRPKLLIPPSDESRSIRKPSVRSPQ